MFSKLVGTIAVGVLAVAFVLPEGDASAFSEPIPTKIGLLKWGGNPRVGKLYKLVSKPSADVSLPDCASGSPVDLGGSLTVTVGDDTLECTLPAADWDSKDTGGWKVLGKCPDKLKGYKYLNKSAPTSDPCKVVIVKGNVIKVLAKNVGGISLPLDSGNPDVGVSLNIGNDSYCALATGPHSKEKADTLIKMKDQAAPASCEICGDNMVNQDPLEECDGTDDSACTCPGAGLCLPPGDPNECTCAPAQCGNNCLEGIEQCDGTDDSACEGLCLPNCTCPEPICNNGVKEASEECDPAGSTDDCPPGEICGGFCECVPDVACDCGTPEPTLYKFTAKAPVEPSCGTTDGEPPIDNLNCMALYIGGGQGALPLPALMPDEGTFKLNVAQCKGSDLTLEHTTPAEVGSLNCTEGRKCSAQSDNPGEPCIRDHECQNGSCETRCFHLAPQALIDRNLAPLSSCFVHEVAEDTVGAVDCATGETFFRVANITRILLTLTDQSPTTPGHQPCPLCLGGTLWVEDSGTCEGGPNDGLRCTPESTPWDVVDCCAGGPNNTRFCSDDSDCPLSTCVSGCTGYPTSHDCLPNPLYEAAALFWVADMKPGSTTKTADGDGNFCGWCRDVEVEGSGCFEGDPDEPDGGQACPDSSVISCRPATYYGPDGGDPADIAECKDGLSCRTDADCQAPYESCEQRLPGAFRDATVRNITVQGKLPESPDLSDKLPHRGVVGTNFCIGPLFAPILDGSASLGGPGAYSLEGEHQLSTSGAFLDVMPGLLD